MPNKNDLHQFYSSLLKMDTDQYLKKFRKKKLRVFQRLLAAIELSEAPTILEVGPGPIGITPLLPAAATYVTIEPGSRNNLSLLESVRDNQLSVTCLEDVADLDERPITADLIFSNASFEHMLSPRDALIKLIQHAKANCYVVIGVPAPRQVEFPDEALVRSGLYEEIDYCSTHLHSFSSKSMQILFDTCGIEMISATPTLLPSRMASYAIINHAWQDFIGQRKKAQSIRWQLAYLFKLLYHRIVADKILDPTPDGDDRGEILYLGRFFPVLV
jgi:hypothetical protein